VPGQQPKIGLRYEILVAASLKTRTHESDGKLLDLTAWVFAVNPQPYNARLTEMGLDITVDLEATHGNSTYLIECKSSTQPGHVLRLSGEEFLKPILEFCALQNFSEISRWAFQYLLVVNFPVGKEVMDLFKKGDNEAVVSLSSRLREFGMLKHGPKFKAEQITPDLVQRTLNCTSILHLTDQYLKERLNSDQSFNSLCETFSSQQRELGLGPIPSRGVQTARNFPQIVFRCASKTHENCDELETDGIVCHVGNSLSFIQSIMARYAEQGSPVCSMVCGIDLGYAADAVVSDAQLSLREISAALTIAFNALCNKYGFNEATLFVVPGTYDLVVGDKKKLAAIVRTHYNPATNKYDLNHTTQFAGLGRLVKIAFAILVLRQAYSITTSEEDYVAEEECSLE